MNSNKLLIQLHKKKIDAALFFSSGSIRDVNLEYFSGFKEPTFSFLLLTKNKSTLIASSIDYERALNEAKVDEVVSLNSSKYRLSKIIKERLNKKNIGIIHPLFPYGYLKKLRGFRFFDISDVVYNIRSIKEKKEIELVKKACKIANKGIKYFERNLSTKLTEKQLSLMLEEYLKNQHADGLAFQTILTSGKRSAFIHPYPSASNNKISKGIGLVDFGVKYKGYCSDVTIPFSIGKLSEDQKKIVNTVRNVYYKLVDSVKEGKYANEIYEIAESLIKRSGFEFKHSVGHGLGLEIHDFPSLSPKPLNKIELKKWKPTILKRGMIVTLEPGIYEVNIGGCRIENDFLITKTRSIALTKARFVEI